MATARTEMELIINREYADFDELASEGIDAQNDDLDDFYPEFDEIWDDSEIPEGIWDEAYLIY